MCTPHRSSLATSCSRRPRDHRTGSSIARPLCTPSRGGAAPSEGRTPSASANPARLRRACIFQRREKSGTPRPTGTTGTSHPCRGIRGRSIPAASGQDQRSEAAEHTGGRTANQGHCICRDHRTPICSPGRERMIPPARWAGAPGHRPHFWRRSGRRCIRATGRRERRENRGRRYVEYACRHNPQAFMAQGSPGQSPFGASPPGPPTKKNRSHGAGAEPNAVLV